MAFPTYYRWSIGSTTLDRNPSTDTGWQVQPVLSQQHGIGATGDIIQFGGSKSPERVIEGLTKTNSIHDALETIKNNGSTVTVKDHFNASASASIKEIKWKSGVDVSNPANNYVSWTYTITLLKH